jgi:hypothetical protein
VVAEEQYPDLADYPSLKDLETSNLFSNRFHGDKDNKKALLALQDSGQQKRMEQLLLVKEPITLGEFLKSSDKKDRKSVVSIFSGLLAFA